MSASRSPDVELPELDLFANGYAPVPHTFGRLFRRVTGLVEVACIHYIFGHTLGAPPRGGEKPEYCDASIEDFQRYAGCSRGAVLKALQHARECGWIESKPAEDGRQKIWKSHPENFARGPLRTARVLTRKSAEKTASVHSSVPIAAFSSSLIEAPSVQSVGSTAPIDAATAKSVHSSVSNPISSHAQSSSSRTESVYPGEPTSHPSVPICANCGAPVLRAECTSDQSCPYSMKNVKNGRQEEHEERASSSAIWVIKSEQPQKEKQVDDDKTVEYASEKDELVALINSQGNSCDQGLLRLILESLELRNVTLRAYLDDIKPRLRRLKRPAGSGFFLHQAENLSASQPVKPQFKDREAQRCPVCANGGYLSLNPRQYCACQMGQEVQRAERRAASGAN